MECPTLRATFDRRASETLAERDLTRRTHAWRSAPRPKSPDAAVFPAIHVAALCGQRLVKDVPDLHESHLVRAASPSSKADAISVGLAVMATCLASTQNIHPLRKCRFGLRSRNFSNRQPIWNKVGLNFK